MKFAFRCPKCKARHTVDAAMAGKKAKCDCGAVMTVPAAPAAKQAQPAASRGGFQVTCTGCGVEHPVDAALAGKSVRCSCGVQFTIPNPHAPAPAPLPAATIGTIQVTCPGCGFDHQAGPELAGRAVRCGCGTTLQVPAAASSGASDLSDLLSELPDDDFGLDPLGPSPSSAGSPLDSIPTPRSDAQVLAQYTQQDDWKRKPSKSSSRSGGGFFAFEAGIANSGVLGGCLTMILSGGLFFLGLAADRIFIWAPVLFAVGCFAVLKGLLGED